MTQIKQAWLVLNNSCNNNCIWCYAKSQRIPIGSFSLSDLKKTIYFLSDIGCSKLVFIGGEPTLYNKLSKAIQMASSRKLRQCIVSNGRMLSSLNCLQRLNSDPNYLDFIISLKGATPETHDAITGIVGSFTESLRGIENCLEQGYSVTPNLTFGVSNSHELDGFLNLATSFKLTTVSINIALPPVGHGFDPKDFLTGANLSKFLYSLAFFSKASPIKIFLSTPLPFCIIPNDLRELIDSGKVTLTTCHILSGVGIVINWNLDVILCTHMPDILLYNIREMKSKNFAHFWDNDMECNLRKELRRLPFARCYHCRFKNSCTGGCPLFSIFYTEKEITINATI